MNALHCTVQDALDYFFEVKMASVPLEAKHILEKEQN